MVRRSHLQTSQSAPTPAAGDGAGAVPQAFRLDVVPEREVVRVCPIGDVDISTVGSIRKQIEALVSDGFDRVVLDLRGTTFLDSTGLRMAVEVGSSAAQDGFDFAIIEGPAAVQRAFEITGLRAQLPFVDPSSRASGPA
jgi:anti-sigma B factor antagonist